jgi:hypothetical protein
MAAQHEQWIIELLSGLRKDEKESMIHDLGKLKTHINRAVLPRKPNQHLHSTEDQ